MAEGAAERVRVDKSAVRCPFCHEDVDVAGADWVACAGCLARHHGECWSEAGRCGACGAAEPLARAGVALPAPAAGPPVPVVATEEPPGAFGRLLGGPRRLKLTRVLAGEVGEEVHEEVIQHVRHVLDDPGQFDRLGRTLSWRSTPRRGSGRDVRLTLTARDGATSLELTEDQGNLMGGLWGGLGGGLGLNLLLHPLVWGLIKGWPWLVAIGVVLFTALMVFIRGIVASVTRGHREELRRLADAIEPVLARSARRPAPPRADSKKELP